MFFLLIGLEWWVAASRGATTYRLGDSVASIGLGTMSQVLGVFSQAVFFGIYVLAWEHLRLVTLPGDAAWVWIAAVVVYDFCYYWQHRLSHEVGVLWAAHVVHHQSEEFNLGTALRQPSTSFLLGWVFYLPMALAGFPPLVFAVAALIDLLYQYWIHTEQIRKLGWFDRVFASPSNHRVHHGVNDRYLDKNYGGILILWDRWFGTFTEEDDGEPVVYGTRSPLRRFDPLWANVEVYHALAKDCWRTRRWADKVRVWFMHPGWRPEDVAKSDPKPPFSIAARVKYAPVVPRATQAYAFVQFALIVVAATWLLAVSGRSAMVERVAAALWITFSLWSVCGLLEGRRLWPFELGRLAVAAGAAAVTCTWFGTPLGSLAEVSVVGALALSMLASVALMRREQGPPSG